MSSNPFAAPSGFAERPDPKAIVNAPAVALMVVSIICIVTLLLALVFDVFLITSGAAGNLPPSRVGISRTAVIGVRMTYAVVILVVNAVILVGANGMRNLRSYGFARSAAILSVIPCVGPCYLLGIPFGIWALSALSKPGVKEAFDSR